MTEIKTWQQRCMEHPDHQAGMVSDEMIYARMCEEIEELRAEIERRVEVLELIRRYMGQGVSWDRAEEKAIDEIEERKARAALEAKP
jgi:hypothetical protein